MSRTRRIHCHDKDIIITDRAFGAVKPDEFTSARILNRSGFGTLISTWFVPASIQYAAKAALECKARGLVQTTWVGYNCREQSLADQPQQFYAFVLAGEYAWSGRNTDFRNLPYQFDEVFKSSYNRVLPRRIASRGFLVDLVDLYNTAMAPGGVGGGESEQNGDLDLPGVPVGIRRLKGDLFHLGSVTRPESAIRLASALDEANVYPDDVMIPLHRRAKSLIFLHTCARVDDPHRRVGEYQVHYSDGTSVSIRLVYGANIAAWNDPVPCDSAQYAWGAENKGGDAISLTRFRWENPSDWKEIESIQIRSERTEAGIMTLAITGICP